MADSYMANGMTNGTNVETTVLGDDNRLGTRHFCGHFGNYRLLVVKIETHGQLLSNSNAETRRWRYGDLHSGTEIPVFG